MRRRIAVPMLLLLLLCACGAENTSAQTPVRFRTSLEGAGGCQYLALITGDYGEYVCQFLLQCTSQEQETTLVVQEPAYAAGIRATVSGEDATVHFGETVVAVEEFSEREISPMAAPYLLEQAWLRGYISATGMDGDYEQVTYLLGYGSDQLTVTTNFDGQVPVLAAISTGGKELITCELTEFSLNQ